MHNAKPSDALLFPCPVGGGWLQRGCEKSGEIVEDTEGGDMAGYQLSSKPQSPHNEGRRRCRTVEEVIGGVKFPTVSCRARRIYG